MMSLDSPGQADRGVSEVIGYVLLVGLVLTATSIAVVMGAEAIDGLEAENDATSAQAILEDIDAELGTIAASSGAPNRTFDFSGTAGGHLSIERAGWLNVSMVSGTDTDRRCSTESTLGTIRFEEDSRVVAYEAGGIWERAPGGGSSMVSRPDVAFREGTLDISLVNTTGFVNQGDTEAAFNRTATRERNLEHRTNLGECESIDHVNITVKSTFHEAWGEYLQEQTGGDLNTTESDDGIVTVELDADELPNRVDMENNDVVNLNDSRSGVDIDYMEDVTFGEDPRNITVDKDADNDYLVSVTSLTDRPPQIGDIQTLQAANVSNRTREPVDAMFVMDESSSMAGDPTDETIEAGKSAVGTLNTSDIGDRAGIVGYHSWPRFTQPNGSYLTSDDAALNSTMDGLGPGRNCNSYTCFTDISSGLNGSLSILSYRETRNDEHVILMSDGANTIGNKHGYNTNFDDRTMNAARIAEVRGHTVHTFAFGTNADEELLKDIADESGGEHDASGDPDGLEEFFQSVIEGITREDDYVTRTPLTTNMTSGGEAHPPQVVGDTDDIANVTSNDGRTFLNINDPTSPTLFSHSFRVEDDEPVVINATRYECADEGWRDTGGSTEVGGTTYPVARCTDIQTSNTSLDDSQIVDYNNGSDVTSLRTNDDINESLDPYTTNESGTYRLTNLSSNQVVINLDFERDPESGLENNLVLLYEIGLSEGEATGADVIDVRESSVTLG